MTLATSFIINGLIHLTSLQESDTLTATIKWAPDPGSIINSVAVHYVVQPSNLVALSSEQFSLIINNTILAQEIWPQAFLGAPDQRDKAVSIGPGFLQPSNSAIFRFERGIDLISSPTLSVFAELVIDYTGRPPVVTVSSDIQAELINLVITTGGLSLAAAVGVLLYRAFKGKSGGSK